MSAPVRIDDPHDTRLTDYVELTDPVARRRRERDEVFVAEGVTAIVRLLQSDHVVRSVLVTPAVHARLVTELDGLAAPVYVAPKAVMAETVGFNLHRGAIAAAERRPLPPLDDLLAAAERIAVLEGLNDPENLGAVARSARALGVDAAVLDPTCIDPYYRRTVRVSLGEVLHLPVARATHWPGDLAAFRQHGIETWAMTPDPDAEDLFGISVPDRVAVLLGSEAHGLSAPALAAADRRVRIPMRHGVDSLNVGHAAAIAFSVLLAAARRR